MGPSWRTCGTTGHTEKSASPRPRTTAPDADQDRDDPVPAGRSEDEDVEQSALARKFAAGKTYPWVVLGLLWLCGFFNYADRQAVNSVFPLLENEFHLSKTQLGML